LNENYIKLENESVLIHQEAVDNLQNVDVIVFDCDGVLIDVRNSYSKAVAKTTSYLIKILTGSSLSLEIFDKDVNFSYKKTGGFNNDWNLTYALIMRILAELPEKETKSIDRILEESLQFHNLLNRFEYLQENNIQHQISEKGLKEKLITFSKQLDSDGILSVDEALIEKVGHNVKKALHSRQEVGHSILATLFEEILSGSKLFQETFLTPARFTDKPYGLIENEEITIIPETWTKLALQLGGDRFGIASGSLRNTALHVLKDAISPVPEKAQIWHDHVSEAQKSSGRRLHKPSPYPLVKAAEQFEPFKYTLYVGDTIADYMTASNASKADPRYLFAGVYEFLEHKTLAKEEFIKLDCDLIVPSVNELPLVFDFLKKLE
jgi:phosphoglycolate phosphatase-like HAD superfamily hydrolase